jgi:hypothetical protein
MKTSSRADRCARLSSIVHHEMDHVPYRDIVPQLVSRRPSFASGALPCFAGAVAYLAEGFSVESYSPLVIQRRPFASLWR